MLYTHAFVIKYCARAEWYKASCLVSLLYCSRYMYMHVYTMLVSLQLLLFVALITSLSSVAHVSCGHSHSLALAVNGQLYAWGNNEPGQLGVPSSLHSHIGQPQSVGIAYVHVHCICMHDKLLQEMLRKTGKATLHTTQSSCFSTKNWLPWSEFEPMTLTC